MNPPPISDCFNSTDPFELSVVCPLLNTPGVTVQFFYVKGKPVPMERPRIVCNKKIGRAWAFTPKNSKAWKDSVAYQVLAQRPKPMAYPYTVVMKFVCEPSVSTDDVFPMAPGHGDLDNLAKGTLDAIFGRGKIFSDDRFIINVVKYKRLPEVGEEPGVKIWVISGGTYG